MQKVIQVCNIHFHIHLCMEYHSGLLQCHFNSPAVGVIIYDNTFQKHSYLPAICWSGKTVLVFTALTAWTRNNFPCFLVCGTKGGRRGYICKQKLIEK